MPKRFTIEGAPYKIRYAILDPHIIYNHAKKDGLPYHIASRKERYDKIEASILKEGFHNPVLVITGLTACTNVKLTTLSQEILDNPKDVIICPGHGGSRLYFAQKHNLPVPCIISDFENRFPEEKTVESFQELNGYFKTKLRKCQLFATGVYIEGLS